MVGNTEEPFPASATTEEQRAQRPLGFMETGRGEERVEVLVGGPCVPDLKLNRLPFLDDVADDDGPRLLVRSQEIADQKIPAGKFRAVFIHGDADMERPLGLRTFIHRELPEDGLQAMQGWDSTEFLNDVLFRLCHDEPVADRPTALRNDRANGDVPGERDTDQAVAVHLFIEEQSILGKILTASCQPAECSSLRIPLFNDAQHVLQWGGEGICEEEHEGCRLAPVV